MSSRFWLPVGLLPAVVLWLATSGCGTGPEVETAGSSDTPTNLIWIVVDTLRPDFLACYGGPAKTPNIDALATKGVLFSRAYSHVPVTGPSHSSMFTGLMPQQHGVAINTQVLAEPLTTVAEILGDRGYHTAAVVSLGVLQRQFGFGQGFKRYDDRFPNQWFRTADEITRSALTLADDAPDGPLFLFVHYSDPHEPYCPPSLSYPRITVEVNGVVAAEVEANGLGALLNIELKPGKNTISFADATASLSRRLNFRQIWIRNVPTELRLGAGWNESKDDEVGSLNIAELPATLLVDSKQEPESSALFHFFAYEELSHDEARERYVHEVEYADQEIGTLMAGLKDRGLLSDAIVVFTSDHGEGLGDHGELGHINQLYDTMVRVPLILQTDTRRPVTGRSEDLVSHIDILPTLLDRLGIELQNDLPGRSLFESHEADETRSAINVLLRTYRPEAPFDLEGIVRSGFKYIINHQTGEEELFSISGDPEESLNLVGVNATVDSQRIASSLALTLTKMSAKLELEDDTRAETPALDQEEIEKLKALGYLN